jgi:hypothetical protein
MLCCGAAAHAMLYPNPTDVIPMPTGFLCSVNPLIHAYMLCKWSLVVVYMPNGLVHMLTVLFIGLLVDSYAH